MNLSTAQASAHLSQKPTSRAIGLGFVAAIHVVAFIAVSQGLMIQPSQKPVEPTVVKPIDETPPEPQPIKRFEPQQPKQQQFTQTVVDPIDFVVTATPPTGGIQVERGDPLPQDLSPRGLVAPPAQTKPNDGIQTVGAVCTRTQAPESPSVNWSGEALFGVVAGTHAGRVNQVEIRLLRGAMDGRTQRAFRSAIESAMREGYQCPGDVRFSQEFQFRVE